MEELGMLGIVGDAAKGIEEEMEMVRTMRAMGKPVSITSQGAGTEDAAAKIIRHQTTHGK